jgi:pSer/pThr/pTyr-binding forkhead associated (FHA) protein
MASLELYDRHGRFGRRVELGGDRVVVGRSDGCDVVVDDSTVSRSHAVLERVGPDWSIRDVGSQNGTVVNGDRLFAPLVLGDGAEITLGRARLVFLNGARKQGSETDPVAKPPKLTPREYRVLCELVRPIRSGSRFTEPAPRAEIAERLFVTEAAVQNHLGSLYLKFDIDEGPGRRTRLANEAIGRGSVDPRDLDDPDEPDE